MVLKIHIIIVLKIQTLILISDCYEVVFLIPMICHLLTSTETTGRTLRLDKREVQMTLFTLNIQTTASAKSQTPDQIPV